MSSCLLGGKRGQFLPGGAGDRALCTFMYELSPHHQFDVEGDTRCVASFLSLRCSFVLPQILDDPECPHADSSNLGQTHTLSIPESGRLAALSFLFDSASAFNEAAHTSTLLTKPGPFSPD